VLQNVLCTVVQRGGWKVAALCWKSWISEFVKVCALNSDPCVTLRMLVCGALHFKVETAPENTEEYRGNLSHMFSSECLFENQPEQCPDCVSITDVILVQHVSLTGVKGRML
jgi:hypothetical protein